MVEISSVETDCDSNEVLPDGRGGKKVATRRPRWTLADPEESASTYTTASPALEAVWRHRRGRCTPLVESFLTSPSTGVDDFKKQETIGLANTQIVNQSNYRFETGSIHGKFVTSNLCFAEPVKIGILAIPTTTSFNDPHHNIMSNNQYRVRIPTNPTEALKLLGVIKTKHEALGAVSPREGL